MNKYAHTKKIDKVVLPEKYWEPIPDHLNLVNSHATTFAKVIGLDLPAKVLSLLHDIGKYDDIFYDRLNEKPGVSFDHAALGARLVDVDSKGLLTQLILGHHGYLPDYRIKPEDQDMENRIDLAKSHQYDHSIVPSAHDIQNSSTLISNTLVNALKSAFSDKNRIYQFQSLFLFGIQKFLFSCLVDADYLSTEQFCQGKIRTHRYESMQTLANKFFAYRSNLITNSKPVPQWIKDMRNDVWNDSLSAANTNDNLYTLTAPTGSGKTFAFLGMAFNKALKEKKDRIIIVLPYCAIITQICEILKNAIGEHNFLEHHSGFDLEEKARQSDSYKQAKNRTNSRKALNSIKHDYENEFWDNSENWDVPIVVTTREQFDESFFSRYPGRSRKIHNMANSVIIFDEVQFTPREWTIPFVGELHVLREIYKSVLVLSTATQPAYASTALKTWGLCGAKEISTNAAKHYQIASQRVAISASKPLTVECLVDEIVQHKQVICVLNTRKNSCVVSEELTRRGVKHILLNTLQCRRHVRASIRAAQRRLKNGHRLILITTQIVEAGVDIDFPEGYSEDAPMDSLLQRAGRINRNGIRPICPMTRFTLVGGNSNRGYSTGISTTDTVVAITGDTGLSSLSTISQYYDSMLKNETKLNDINVAIQTPNVSTGRGGLKVQRSVVDGLSKVARTEFSEFDKYNYIGNRISIIIPIDKKSKKTVEKLKILFYSGKKRNKRLTKQLREYTISVYQKEAEELMMNMAVEEIYNDWVLTDLSYYNKKTGLQLSGLNC